MMRFTEEWLAQRNASKRMSKEVVALELPFPPTVNHMYEPAGRGRRKLTDEAKAYREDVAVRCVAAQAGPVHGKIRVVIYASPPDARRRDLDNLQKSVLDALQHSGVYGDDYDIDDLRILRIVGKPGTISVFIEAIRQPGE